MVTLRCFHSVNLLPICHQSNTCVGCVSTDGLAECSCLCRFFYTKCSANICFPLTVEEIPQNSSILTKYVALGIDRKKYIIECPV
jgi:hypothetical protein